MASIIIRKTVEIKRHFKSVTNLAKLFLAKIKGEVALALLAAPSYVHVPSPLQVKWPVPKSKRNLTCSFAR
jgi:hypothetical protein